MKKDIEWLKGRFRGRKLFKPQNDREIGYNVAIDEFSEYVDQLDEPETVEQTTHLLESVLKENKRLGKLLEEKHEEWLELMDLINTQETLSEYWIEQKSIDTHVDTLSGEVQMTFRLDDLQNLLVPKQELPVIPKFVAEAIEEDKECGYDVYESIDLIIGTNGGGLPSISDWVARNIDKYARAYLDGFTVEEEQKYYAKIKGHEQIGSNDKYWNYEISTEELDIGDNKVHPDVLAEYMLKATKDEWANLGINKDNADFVKVEEMEQ